MANPPRVLCCMPSRGEANIHAANSHYVLPTAGGCQVIPGVGTSSLLPHMFNRLWANALDWNDKGVADYWCLHHDDIEVHTHGWLDVMLEEMRRAGVAVLSVVQPIKDGSGETSTAVEWLPPWVPRKLTLEEVGKLPQTFTTRDTPWPDKPLLINTGLMLVDLARPEWRDLDADGCMRFFFTFHCRILVKDGERVAQIRPEDWEFSRQLAAAGVPYAATTKVQCSHWGSFAYGNQPPREGHHYQQVQGWFDFEDVYLEVARRLPPGGRFVEVGCHKGKSLSFLLVELRKAGGTAFVHGVDDYRGLRDGDDRPRAVRDALAAECEANLAKSLYPSWELVREASRDAARKFCTGSCDAVFLDGGHEYAAVLGDARAWWPKVKPGGVLAGHDWDKDDVRDAVNQAAKELGFAFVIKGNCWWAEKGGGP